MNRIEEFNNTYNFNPDELIKIEFKPGCRPRNATDYYYPKTKAFYAYYFGDTPGSWAINPEIDTFNIRLPVEASSDKSIIKTSKKTELDDYRLELEIMKLKAEIKLEKLKTKSEKYIK